MKTGQQNLNFHHRVLGNAIRKLYIVGLQFFMGFGFSHVQNIICCFFVKYSFIGVYIYLKCCYLYAKLKYLNSIIVKNAIIDLFRSLQESGSDKGSFVYKGRGNDKSATLKISRLDTGLPVIGIEELQGFSQKYIRSKAGLSLLEVTTGDLPIAVSGLTVYTRVPAALNEKKRLPADTRFYATQGTILYCGGKRLGIEFDAECIQVDYAARCYPDGATQVYTIYKLS